MNMMDESAAALDSSSKQIWLCRGDRSAHGSL